MSSRTLSIFVVLFRLTFYEESEAAAVIGVAGVDYPNYQKVLLTNFRCPSEPGMYPDPETQCQMYHVCQANGRKDAFLCTEGTLYNSNLNTCDYWFNVNCDGRVHRQQHQTEEKIVDPPDLPVRTRQMQQQYRYHSADGKRQQPGVQMQQPTEEIPEDILPNVVPIHGESVDPETWSGEDLHSSDPPNGKRMNSKQALNRHGNSYRDHQISTTLRKPEFPSEMDSLKPPLEEGIPAEVYDDRPPVVQMMQSDGADLRDSRKPRGNIPSEELIPRREVDLSEPFPKTPRPSKESGGNNAEKSDQIKDDGSQQQKQAIDASGDEENSGNINVQLKQEQHQQLNVSGHEGDGISPGDDIERRSQRQQVSLKLTGVPLELSISQNQYQQQYRQSKDEVRYQQQNQSLSLDLNQSRNDEMVSKQLPSHPESKTGFMESVDSLNENSGVTESSTAATENVTKEARVPEETNASIGTFPNQDEIKLDENTLKPTELTMTMPIGKPSEGNSSESVPIGINVVGPTKIYLEPNAPEESDRQPVNTTNKDIETANSLPNPNETEDSVSNQISDMAKDATAKSTEMETGSLKLATIPLPEKLKYTELKTPARSPNNTIQNNSSLSLDDVSETNPGDMLKHVSLVPSTQLQNEELSDPKEHQSTNNSNPPNSAMPSEKNSSVDVDKPADGNSQFQNNTSPSNATLSTPNDAVKNPNYPQKSPLQQQFPLIRPHQFYPNVNYQYPQYSPYSQLHYPYFQHPQQQTYPYIYPQRWPQRSYPYPQQLIRQSHPFQARLPRTQSLLQHNLAIHPQVLPPQRQFNPQLPVSQNGQQFQTQSQPVFQTELQPQSPNTPQQIQPQLQSPAVLQSQRQFNPQLPVSENGQQFRTQSHPIYRAQLQPQNNVQQQLQPQLQPLAVSQPQWQFNPQSPQSQNEHFRTQSQPAFRAQLQPQLQPRAGPQPQWQFNPQLPLSQNKHVRTQSQPAFQAEPHSQIINPQAQQQSQPVLQAQRLFIPQLPVSQSGQQFRIQSQPVFQPQPQKNIGQRQIQPQLQSLPVSQPQWQVIPQLRQPATQLEQKNETQPMLDPQPHSQSPAMSQPQNLQPS